MPQKKLTVGEFNSYFFGTLRGSTLRFERFFSWSTTLYLKFQSVNDFKRVLLFFKYIAIKIRKSLVINKRFHENAHFGIKVREEFCMG